MKDRHARGKKMSLFIRAIPPTLVLAAGLLAAGVPALAAGGGAGGSGDNGGNGEGTLLIYSTLSAAEQSGAQTYALTAGSTYYIVLANPGGKTSETNLHHVPTQLDFEFYMPAHVFQGNPYNSNTVTPTFGVANALEQGTGSPYIYKVTIPSKAAPGDYSIATFGTNTQPQSNGGKGEDEFFFSTDPTIGSGLTIQAPPPTNNLPEIPFAGVLPLTAVAVGGVAYAMRRRGKAGAR